MVEQVASGNATAFLCFAVRQNISCELVAPIKAVVAVAILPWLRTFFFVVVAVRVGDSIMSDKAMHEIAGIALLGIAAVLRRFVILIVRRKIMNRAFRKRLMP
jgi:hypothetical protein